MAEVVRSEPTFCRICEAACGLRAELDASGQVVRLRPDVTHPVSRGYVCAKGTRFAEVAADPGRLRQPYLGRGTARRAASWDDAMQVAGDRLRRVIDRHGPHAVGIYFGNPLAFNLTGAVATAAFWRALGTRNVYAAGSQDCNNKFAGAALMHGSSILHPIPDFARCDLAVLFGSNPAVSQASFVHLEGGARVFDDVVRRGGEVVVVDPRRNESAVRWGGHVAIRPGTDVYLLLALVHLFRDRARTDARVAGLDALLAVAAQYPPARAAALTGIPAGEIEALAAKIARAERTALHLSVGVNQSGHGTLAYVALQALSYLSGNFDRRGGHLFHPLAVRAAKLGALPGVGMRRHRSRIGGFESVLETLPGGVLADEILIPGDERIRAMVVIAGDPLRSIPGAGRLAEAFASLETVISIDLFANASAEYADVLLPATSWLERFDVATTTAFFQQAPHLQFAGPVAAPPGDARPEAQILAELAVLAGRPLGRSVRLSRLLARLLDGRRLQRWTRRVRRRGYDSGLLPVPRPRPGRYLGRGPCTPGRRVRFWDPRLQANVDAAAAQADARERQIAPWLLTSRRRRLAHNSWLHGAVRDGDAEASVLLCPADARQLGVAAGDSVCVSAGDEQLILPAKLDDAVQPGTVVVPHGLPEVNLNRLLPAGVNAIEPLSGQLRMTAIPVQVTAAA